MELGLWLPLSAPKHVARTVPPERPLDARRRAIGTLLGCCVARFAGTLYPVVNGVSMVSGLSKSGDIRSDVQTLASKIESRFANLDDRLNRSTRRASSGAGKRGLTSLPITL